MSAMFFSDADSRKMWDDKFTFFWYNAPEIFRWSQEDFNTQAEEFSKSGITYVMTFSVTHFRGCFEPWRQEILAAISKLVAACRKYNIKVVEHHSACLSYTPETPEQWQKLAGYFKLHNSSFDDFPGFREHIAGIKTLNGIPFKDLLQISGRTGKLADTPYMGRAFCFNNPDFRNIYKKYIEDLHKVGVECLLADDIQLFGSGSGCCCKYCRERFRRETGMELPTVEAWNEFENNFDDPLYIEFLRFRERTTADFQYFLSEEYQRLGMRVLRPNYRASLIARDFFATTFTSCLDYWEHTFQENMFSLILRLSWCQFYCEAILQYSIGERRNAPSMSLFYPSRYDEYYFAWALCMSWGQLPFLCPEGGNMAEEDKFFNGFESQYSDLLRQQKKLSDLAFIMSRETFDHSDSVKYSYFQTRGLLNGAYFDHLQLDMVSEDESISAFTRHKTLVAAGLVRVTNSLAEKLLEYLDQGGKLLVFGEFGIYDTVPGISQILQHKNCTLLSGKEDTSLFQKGVLCTRMHGESDSVAAPPYMFDKLRMNYGRMIRNILKNDVLVKKAPDGYMFTMYSPRRKNNIINIHLVNINGMLVQEGCMVNHEMPVPNFGKDAAGNTEPLELSVNIAAVDHIRLITPEKQMIRQIDFTGQNNSITILIPPASFSGYALLEVTLKN